VKTLLIVDSDPDDLEMFCQAAHEVDSTIKCIECSDYLTAKRMMRMAVPDLAFIEAEIQGYSGSQLMKEIRMEPRLASLPVYMLSRTTNANSSALLKSIGAQHVFRKPAGKRGYVQIIRQALLNANVISFSLLSLLRAFA
jgi:DNA-binding response OmpR family regulator